MKWSLVLMWVLGGCDLYWPNPNPGDRAGGRDHNHYGDGGHGPTADARGAEAAIGDARDVDGEPADAASRPDAAPDTAPDAPPDAPPDAAPVVPPCDLFDDPVTFPTGVNPTGIAVADFNSDGSPDVAILDFSTEAVSVHLNETASNATTPIFSAASNTAIGRVVIAFAAGDLNGDGKADIVVPGGDHSIALLINNTATGAAAASFATRTIAADEATTYVALVDINRDGRLDLAVSSDRGNGTQSVSVYLNTTPAGQTVPSFAPYVDFLVGGCMGPVVSADFNGDGIPDLATASCTNRAGTVAILLGTTATNATVPSFQPQAIIASNPGFDMLSLATADFNGDWRPDLVTAATDYSQHAVVETALNATGFAAATPAFGSTFSVGGGLISGAVAAADLDNDDRPDLVVSYPAVSYPAGLVGGGFVSIQRNVTPTNATMPTFETCAELSNPAVADIAVADFNGDGKPDLGFANEGSTTNSFSIYLHK